MANLIKCKDCGHEISKKAKECPNCGAPQKKKSNFGCLSVLVFGGFIVWLVYVSVEDRDSSYQRTPTTTASSGGKITYYAKNTVNIRRGPSTDHDIVDQLQKGQAWRCYPKGANEVWIKCASDEYIHSSLLSSTPIRTQTTNEMSSLLVSMSALERASTLANLLHQSGNGCGEATRTFLQGHDKDDAAYWNVSCSNGQSYNVQIPSDPSANTRILECDFMKLIGVECFKEFSD